MENVLRTWFDDLIGNVKWKKVRSLAQTINIAVAGIKKADGYILLSYPIRMVNLLPLSFLIFQIGWILSELGQKMWYEIDLMTCNVMTFMKSAI